MNGKECRTGENRANGTVTYNQDGLYLYEFKTREDAYKYFFEDNRSIPYAFAEYNEDESEEKGEETFGKWEFNNGFKPEWLDANKMKFSTIEEGVKAIREACNKAEISEGEFADYLILHYDECFSSSIEPVIAIQAIQKFRQWDYETEDDAVECFGGTEALSENAFYGFIFERDGKSRQLPDGVRIGIMQEGGGIVLDEGIIACFSEVKYGFASGSFTEDSEPFENYRIAIGQWDGVTNDDDIFHWFSHEDKIIGSHADFIITSYIKDGDSEEKRVSATPWFCIAQNTEEEGSSILEDYNTLKKAMEAYNYIKENGYHRVENGNGTDDDIVTLKKGTKISMNIEWRETNSNCLVPNEGIDVPVIVIENDNIKCEREPKTHFAWEVSNDDIALALQEMSLPNGDTDVEEVRDFLDCDAVEHEALKSNTLEKQSANALQEIINQINQNF